MNLPEPSGSSPALNPPGIIMILLLRISPASLSTDSCTSSAERFLKIIVSTRAPAFSNATALSYSQFVPGNTGIITLGLAIFKEAAILPSALYFTSMGIPALFIVFVGKTSSSFPVYESRSSSMRYFLSLILMTFSVIVFPITGNVVLQSTSAIMQP